MDASPIDCIFTVSRATVRTTAYLRCRRPPGHRIHCKYAVVLFGGRARPRRSMHGTFSASWRLLGCSPGLLEKVLQIRGAHQDGHQLESLHFYGVPWPHPRGQKSSKKEVVKLTTFFQKSRFQNPGRSTARIASFGGVIVIASTGSIANKRSP